MTILDNILLHLLSKSDGETLEEKTNNLTFISFISGMILLLASLLSLLYGAITNSFFSQGCVLHFFVSCLGLGVFVTFLNSFLEKYLKKLIKRHTVIEHSKVRSKEIYKPSTEVELSIRGLGTDTPISTKETFSNEKLNKLKGRRVIIEAFKKGEVKSISGGEVEISLTNKDEIASLNVPEEVLVYKIEGVSITKEIEQRVCGFIKEKETTVFRTKIFLSASVDEELLEKIKSQKELDDLLTL